MSVKKFLVFMVAVVIIVGGFVYPINYYIMSPGNAYDLTEYVEVEHADAASKGTLSMMTVAMSTATPFTYLYAKFADDRDVLKEEEVRAPEESDAEYNLRQLKLMTDSQFNAKYMAFKSTGHKFTVNYNGVYVIYVLEGAAASKILQAGDEVTKIDGKMIEKHQDLVDYLKKKKKGDKISLTFKREDKTITKNVTLKEIPGAKGKIGLGITFSDSKSITTDPEVKINSEDIGGPSAGLMFTLEIIDQLTDGDLTKGHKIAGTGEMLENGEVGRIGGIDKKVIAADRDGVEIFFAPDDTISKELKKAAPNVVSNYEEAVAEAKKIKSDMKIVPVKNLESALAYLDKLK
ncbi:MAG: PDZ domain-containing protein [Kurthia sp.]|nr:PDZ domain-containing protein [Candidatus Kurthia equi]